MTKREQWGTFGRWVAIGMVLGAPVGLVPAYLLGGADGAGLVAGLLTGLIIGGGMVGFEVAWVVGLISRRWREARFLVLFVSRSLVWLVIIVVGIVAPMLLVERVSISELPTGPIGVAVGIAFVAALVINFISQINRVLGRGVLVRLILGRYHQPREETRIFLLVDLRGSTPIAEGLGNLRYHQFLRRFIGDVTISALRFGAEVHRYVGDEVILTWDRRGLNDAACIRSVFAMADAIEAAQEEYEADFGSVPRFWAGVHLGPVITGEMGTIKQEIVYTGDTLNTTARIEAACREYQQPFLASADVVDNLELPDDVLADRLGPVELRGVAEPIELVALSRG